MKTIIIAVAMIFMACLLTLHTNATFEGWVYLGLFLFIWSLMVVEFVNSLRRKPKPEPDYRQMYFQEHIELIELQKEVEKASTDTDSIFNSSGKIYAKNKFLQSNNEELVNENKRIKNELNESIHKYSTLELEIEELKEKVDYFYNEGLKKDKENNRLTSKVVELTSEKKDLVDQVNGYRGAFKRHKKGEQK